ncbi:MAG TPA: ATP-grasp domain-containing protein [Terriglobales bacterium]|nr:ATP-grasp domain-containing protein [Terriglobales bacterium]
MNRAVLVLGSVPRVTTAIARSLSPHSIPVDVAAFSPVEPRIPSRTIRHFWRIPDPDSNSAEFLDSLRNIIQANGHDMLIPVNDVAMTAIVDHCDNLRELLYVACPPAAIARRVLDKTVTMEIARAFGIRVPQSKIVSNSAEISTVAGQLGFPLVLKPAIKERAEEFKTRLVANPEALGHLFPEPRQFPSPILVQEYCAGNGVGIELLMHNGQSVAAFQHRRIKEYPHGGGVAVIAVAEALDQKLLESSLSLLRALDWEGVAMVEFKIGKEAVLMEVNGRFWGTISLPIMAGIDFPLYLWKIAHDDQPHVPAMYRVGTRWRWSAGYIRRFRGLLSSAIRQASAREKLMRDVKEAFHDFGLSTKDSLWKFSDPAPAVSESLGTAWEMVVSDFAKATQHFRHVFSKNRVNRDDNERQAVSSGSKS